MPGEESMNSDVTTKSQESGLKFSLRTVPSKLRVTGGREIPFKRVVLAMRNTGNAAIVRFVPHATLAQEGGSVHDITEALTRATPAEPLPPGGSIEWDVYDLLLAAHPGVGSKVHLWGYKAMLNWWIDLSVWAEYLPSDNIAPLNTQISRWRLRWIPAHATLEEIDLSMEVVEK
jgi:hypothetical protein